MVKPCQSPCQSPISGWDSYGKLWDFMGFVEISGSFIENNVE
jgi:hypothetical protein